MDAATTLKLGRVYRAIDTLAEGVSPDLTMRQILTILYVASRDEVTQQQIAQDMDMEKSTTSKIVSSLTGQLGATKMNGLNVFRVDINPEDMRGRVITISKEADRLLTKMTKVLFD